MVPLPLTRGGEKGDVESFVILDIKSENDVGEKTCGDCHEESELCFAAPCRVFLDALACYLVIRGSVIILPVNNCHS